MDIGHNLFYNENAMHSGNFFEELTRFGKETMRKKIIMNLIALSVCVLICGCTRREQLILEDVSREQEQKDGLQTEQGHSESVQQALTGKDVGQGLQEENTGQQITAEWQPAGQGPADESETAKTIFVHVCGAVVNPDVYELPVGSRVYEAVRMAGGFTENADSNYVNQAQLLSDGVKLVIPTLEQTQLTVSEGEEGLQLGIVGNQGSDNGQNVSNAAINGSEGSGQGDGKININTASEAELCNIPGIGAVRAAAIVAYRQDKGGFSSIEDIMNVAGIKEGTYEKIKDSIKVN